MGNAQTLIHNKTDHLLHVSLTYPIGTSGFIKREIESGGFSGDEYTNANQKLSMSVEGKLGSLTESIPADKDVTIVVKNGKYFAITIKTVNIVNLTKEILYFTLTWPGLTDFSKNQTLNPGEARAIQFESTVSSMHLELQGASGEVKTEVSPSKNITIVTAGRRYIVQQ